MNTKSNFVLTRWSIPFAGFLLALMGGMAYTWSVFLTPLQNTFGWTSAQAALPLTVYVLFFTATAIVGGKYQDKFGPRIVSFVGALLLFSGYLLASFIFRVPHFMWLVFTFGMIGGIGCGLSYSCVVPSARKWFPDKPALAISIGVMGFGLSAVLFAPLIAGVFLPRFGISNTFVFLGVLAVVISLFASWLIRVPSSDFKPEGFENSSSKIKNKDVRAEVAPGKMVKTPLFYVIWGLFFLSMAGGFSYLTLVAKYGQETLNLTALQAAFAVSMFAIFNGIGRPAAGYLADKVGALTVMIPTYLAQGVVFILFTSIATDMTFLYLTAALFGWGFAVSLALFPTLTSVNFGVKNLGVNYGIVLSAFGVAGLFPVLSSIIYDRTENFTIVFVIAGVMSVAGVVLALVLKKKYSLD